MIFSAYRKDDFADAEGFAVQLATVLERYPDGVIEAVTGPLTGIQRRSKFPPTLAEIVTACDDETGRRESMARYAAMRRQRPAGLLTYERQGPVRAEPNLFVPPDAPRYQEMHARHLRTKGAESDAVQRTTADGEIVGGVMVPISWWHEGAKVRALTDAVEPVVEEIEPPGRAAE